MKQCIGCGFCCKKAPCEIAIQNGLFESGKGCKKLIWDEENWRYWCGVIKDNRLMYDAYAEGLAIGAGCCCGLNSDRLNIPAPDAEVRELTVDWRRAFQILSASVGREWVGGDVISFIAGNVMREAGEFVGREFVRHVKDQRRSNINSFMGDIQE